MPPRLVVCDVSVLTPAAHRNVDRCRRDFRADLLRSRWQHPESLCFWNRQLRLHSAIEMLLHEGSEIVRVIGRQHPPLPVQAFVHVKHEQITQRDVSRVHQFRERRIPTLRTTRNNRPRPKLAAVIGLNYCDQLLRHHPAHRRRICDHAEGNLQFRMLFELLRRNLAPAVKVLLRYVTHRNSLLIPIVRLLGRSIPGQPAAAPLSGTWAKFPGSPLLPESVPRQFQLPTSPAFPVAHEWSSKADCRRPNSEHRQIPPPSSPSERFGRIWLKPESQRML